MRRPLRIAQIGHPILRQPTRTLTREELLSDQIQSFLDDLVETMREANGAGLAANQVYQSLRICTVEVRNNPRYPYRPNIPLTILVNPILTPAGDETFVNYEGCLSVPDLRGQVRRHCEIKVDAWDREGNSISTVVNTIDDPNKVGSYHKCIVSNDMSLKYYIFPMMKNINILILFLT